MDRHLQKNDFLNRLAKTARQEAVPNMDVTDAVMTQIRRRQATLVRTASEWPLGIVALASCAAAVLAVMICGDAFNLVFDPLNAVLTTYPSIQF